MESSIYLKEYAEKKISLRTLAKKLNIDLWKAHEIASKVEFPYDKDDLKRELKKLKGVKCQK